VVFYILYPGAMLNLNMDLFTTLCMKTIVAVICSKT